MFQRIAAEQSTKGVKKLKNILFDELPFLFREPSLVVGGTGFSHKEAVIGIQIRLNFICNLVGR